MNHIEIIENAMNKTLLLIIRALLTAAFAAAGLAKLAGAEMMVQTFDAVGLGQWFRYVTGAIALWLPGLQAYAAGLLVCTMIGALIAHAVVLGLAAGLPALVLGALAAVILWAYRAQLSR